MSELFYLSPTNRFEPLTCAQLATVLLIAAFIVGEESLSAADPATVIITIDDINDTPPIFDSASYEVPNRV